MVDAQNRWSILRLESWSIYECEKSVRGSEDVQVVAVAAQWMRQRLWAR